MGIESGVNWTDASHGFWTGCRKVSPGCDNCYAKSFLQDRLKKDFSVVTRTKGFSNPLKWKEPKRIFVCPQSDFFISDADQWRDDAWDVIRNCPQHTFLILTKRPERIIGNLPIDGCPKNVRIGVTAENQEQWDKRVHILTSLGMKNFVSVEPMLGPIVIPPLHGELVDWVICGGESGPNARHMAHVWAEHLKGQCEQFYSIPFFMKQMSGKTKKDLEAIPDHLSGRSFPENVDVRKS